MDRVPGIPLGRVWHTITWDAKVACVKEVAGIIAQLFQMRYDSIENLYQAKDIASDERGSPKNAAESNPPVVEVDRIVSLNFFRKTHLKSNVHWGPFASSEDLLDAKFQLTEEDLTRISKSKDAEKNENAKKARQLLDRLRKQMRSFFNFYDRGEFALHHSDIHEHNLILDSTGMLRGLVDWKCVSVMLLWKVCQMPKFILSK